MQVHPLGNGGVFGIQQPRAVASAMTNSIQPAAGRQDKVNFSPQGKLAAILEGFQQQREAVIEQKSELIAKTLESGKSLETIEDPLALLDEKLANLEVLRDQTIANYNEQMARELQKQSEKGGKAEKKDEAAEDPEGRHIKTMSEVANGMEQVKVSHSAGARLECEARVAEREARQDGFIHEARYLHKWEKMGGAERAFLNSARRGAKVEELNARADQRQAAGIQSKAVGKLAEISEKAREINEEDGKDKTGEDASREAAAAAEQAAK